MEIVLWLASLAADFATEGLPRTEAVLVWQSAWSASHFLTLSEPSFLGHAELHLVPLIMLAGMLAGVSLVRHAIARLSAVTLGLAVRRLRWK